jgi:hypothetical protein
MIHLRSPEGNHSSAQSRTPRITLAVRRSRHAGTHVSLEARSRTRHSPPSRASPGRSAHRARDEYSLCGAARSPEERQASFRPDCRKANEQVCPFVPNPSRSYRRASEWFNPSRHLDEGSSGDASTTFRENQYCPGEHCSCCRNVGVLNQRSSAAMDTIPSPVPAPPR